MLQEHRHNRDNAVVSFGSRQMVQNPVSVHLAITPEDIEGLAHGRCLVRKIAPGATVLEQGAHSDSVYVLLDGWAFCYKVLEDGRRQILDLVLPGSILGFTIGEQMHHGVEAKTACRIAVFNRKTFNTELLKRPGLCLKCASLFANAESRALERLSRVGRLSALERVAGLLAEMAKRLHAIGDSRQGVLNLLLTQCEIAEMLGLAKETVCRALKQLKQQGLVDLHAGLLVIHDFDGLLNASGDDTESFFEDCNGQPVQLIAS